MPQDRMRNAVYRSLVTCSDPNGVVEYKTMRKSKSSSSKGQQKTEELVAPKASNKSSKGIKEESQAPLPSSILEVSRGAQKLNLMLDSWSERRSYDGQSRDITRDLLKGALELQESLVMLCKLQEPSKCSSQMKPGHGKNYQGGIDGVGVGRNDSDRFTEKSKRKEIDSGRPFDGSSKNSVEELKKVIKDSLTRQNLLSNPFTEETDSSFAPRKSNNFSDIPSTSSSQSSALYSTNSASMDWSVASTSKEVKAENISLIGRLMGLEGFPTEKTPSHLKWQNRKRCLDIPRSINDIERPNASYSSSYDRKSETKTLKEVIDTMHLKGLLHSNDLEELEQNPRTSCDSCSKEDDIQFSPIVVMKPLRFPSKSKEDSLPRNSSQESLYNFRKLESREESSIRRYHQTERGPQLLDVHNKLEAKEKLQSGASLHRKEALSIRRVSDTTQKTKETSIRRSTREQVASSLKEKAEDNKRMGKVKKVMSKRKSPVEMENTKSVTMLRSPDHIRPNSMKASKHDSGPIITKSLMHRKESPFHNPTMKSKSASSIDQVKNVLTSKVKTVTESTRTTSVAKRSRPKDSEKNNHINKIASVPTITTSALEDQLCTTESKETSVQIIDLGEQQKSPLCEVPMEACQDGSIIESAEALEHLVDHNVKIEEAVQSAINQNEFLPSSPQSFLSFAEDHFELHINQQTAQKPALTLEALDMTNPILFLDCANELMECQRHRIMLAGYHLFWIPAVNVRKRICPQQLLGEVCDGINKLKNYFKIDGDIPGKDGIDRMLENDIMRKLPITGDLWNLGWEYGSSMNEVDQVLGEVQEQVLNELIEEITVDYY